jgi:cyclophilin family peptidyl-prolyl cis-trans isomerase
MKNLKLAILLGAMATAGDINAQTEATFYTGKGSFTVALTDSLTPRTVDSFIARVSEGFYDGLKWHRVAPNFVIQGGDPTGGGSGGPGYTIPDETHPTLKHVAKAIGMANAGPNTNGSQFFINLKDNPSLNGIYTMFGMVTTDAGFDVVKQIGLVPVNGQTPVTDIFMDSIRITKFAASVPDVPKENGIKIAPNPNNGRFTIDLPSNTETKVEIVNLNGQVIYRKTAKGNLKVDLGTRSAGGMYIIRLTNEHGSFESKLLVQ